ncbi:ATP-binding protein [Kribbella sancticallisti]|uniref:ATP-binding protein n=1 Tax=Kribbella sancticallisti TaxID=460087 RepID=UPI0031E2845D
MGQLSASFGELLRRHRLAAGLTQAGLAEAADLSEQAVSMLERGSRRRPRVATVEALAAALKLTDENAQNLALAVGVARRKPPDAPARTTSAAPRQLPPTVSDFTGRADELDAALRALADSSRQNRGSVGLVAVTGMGGVGKTALALQAAHRTTEMFPDGHLYLNLRGYGPGAPMPVSEALSQLLQSLGVQTQSVPPGVEEASALLRSMLAGQRVLILLDNAVNVRHIVPLLPGSAGSAAIVTSRRSMTTLPGSKQIRLDPFSERESLDLLSSVVGPDRIEAEPDAAETLVRLVGRLPLAVRLVSARLAARPAWPLQHLVDQLQDEYRRLDSLGVDDTGVRASISGSVAFLESSDEEVDRRSARALPLLGLPDGMELITSTAARILDASELQSDAILERLVDLNLLESIGPGRYRFHDLVRAYARELGGRVLTEKERDSAMDRVLRFYAAIAWSCHELTHSASPRLVFATTRSESLPAFADGNALLRWLDAEFANVTEVIRQAGETPNLRTAILPELALALFGYTESRARWSEMREFLRGMPELAEALELNTMAAWLQHDRAIPEVENGDLESARSLVAKALTMFEALADERGEARCCSSLSHILERLGRIDEALAMISRALSLSLRIGDTTVEGVSYLALARLHNRNGDFAQADQAFERSFALAEQAGDLRSLAKRYLNAGLSYLAAGRLDDAGKVLSKGLQATDELGDINAQSDTLMTLAKTNLANGDLEPARRHAEASLELVRTLDNKLREGRLLILLGKISNAAGDEKEAGQYWHEAASILNPIPTRHLQELNRLLAQSPHHSPPG